MPVLLKDLLVGREKPECVEQPVKVREALKTMLKYDYSQLPIVDRHGQLVGLVSEKSIARTHYDYSENFTLDLTVNDCSAPAITMADDRELTEALDRIKNVDAIVIVSEANKPVGILTDYDMTQFLRDLYEAYTLLEDIEGSIDDLIENALSTENIRNAALFHAFGASKRDPSKPNREFGELSLHEKAQLIITDENWSKFEPVLKQKAFFKTRMEKLGSIRNPFMHFQGRPDRQERETLRSAALWAGSLLGPSSEQIAERQMIAESERATAVGRQHKYDPLREWLKARSDGELAARVAFQDLEKLLGTELPSSAYEHRSWWANDGVGHVQSKTWLDVGWRVTNVDFAAREVTFQRPNAALYQQFFADLLARLKAARPGLTNATKAQTTNWFSFSAGRGGFSLSWSFGKGDVLRVEINMVSQSKEVNRAAFKALEKQKGEIEQELGMHLIWEERPENVQKTIRVTHPAKITDDPKELEVAKEWALQTMLKFVTVFQPRIKAL